MVVIPVGILMFVSDEQFENDFEPIFIIDCGRSIVFNFVKFSNDESPIVVTDEGIVISVIFENNSQSIFSIFLTFDEKNKCFKLLQFSNEL